MPEPLKPLSLRRDGAGLQIEWNDGTGGFVSFRRLRKECPCASCNEERQKPPDPFKVLSAKELAAPTEVLPVRMVARGHYAYQVAWNDGHDTGIYTIEHLRQLCDAEAADKPG